MPHPPGLARLNDTERRVLALLAQGHTAKSIAAELGISTHAVNERLREARRKTGAGSSRELARLLAEQDAPQENRDDQIGVAAAARPRPERQRAIPRIAGVVMIAILIAAGLAFWAIPQDAEPRNAEPGPPADAPFLTSFGPSRGDSFPGGPITLEFTFDRAMRPGSYSFVTLKDDGKFPDCPNPPRQSQDGRSFLLDCTIVAGETYAIGVNSNQVRKFVGAEDGVPAQSAKVSFLAE